MSCGLPIILYHIHDIDIEEQEKDPEYNKAFKIMPFHNKLSLIWANFIM